MLAAHDFEQLGCFAVLLAEWAWRLLPERSIVLGLLKEAQSTLQGQGCGQLAVVQLMGPPTMLCS